MTIRVVFTGKLSQSRPDMEAHAASCGFVAIHKVESGTDYLVVGKRPGKTKLNDAQRWGVRQITEYEYEVLAHTKGRVPLPTPAAMNAALQAVANKPARSRKKKLAIEKRPEWLEGLRSRPASVKF